MWHGEFRHPRLVEVYDAQCVWSREDEFFLAIVNETPAARVADLGCGTGRLTLALAAAGHRVTGVDPAAASLDAARGKPGAEQVTWLLGTSEALTTAAFDVAVMTAHVAQFLVDDEDWCEALRNLHGALVPGGRLVFDTRDPRARAWEHWNPQESRQHFALSNGTSVEVWTEVTEVLDGVVSFTHSYRFSDGEELHGTANLRFRSEQAVRQAVEGAGFTVEQVYGGWHRDPVGSVDGELLVLATKPRAPEATGQSS